MTRDRLPPHVMHVRVKGRDYYYLQRGRGTGQAAKKEEGPPGAAKIAELRAKLNAALLDVGKAILDERELCARVADRLAERDPAQAHHYQHVAALIRARD